MDVNFIFELISLIIMIIICFIITFEVQVIAKDKNFPLLFYLRLTSWSLFLYFLTNTISIILTDEIFALIAIFLMFPYIFFFIMFVNGIMKESYLSIGLIVACCLGISLIFSSFQTGALQVVIQLGYEKYISTGLFYITKISLYLFINSLGSSIYSEDNVNRSFLFFRSLYGMFEKYLSVVLLTLLH
ncbi:MAG: hypothetical protein P8Y97_10105 [Candidatus Lokiarchaeota archaeon]